MVLKRQGTAFWLPGWFENDVKVYGTQTIKLLREHSCGFENDVKVYGTQTGSRGYASV